MEIGDTEIVPMMSQQEAAVYAARAFYEVIRKLEFDEGRRRRLLVSFLYGFFDEASVLIDGESHGLSRDYLEKILSNLAAA